MTDDELTFFFFIQIFFFQHLLRVSFNNSLSDDADRHSKSSLAVYIPSRLRRASFVSLILHSISILMSFSLSQMSSNDVTR